MFKWFPVVRCLLLNTAVNRRLPTLLELSWNSSAIRATWWLEKTVVGATPRPNGAGESGAIPSASVSPFIHFFLQVLWLLTPQLLTFSKKFKSNRQLGSQKSQIFVSKFEAKWWNVHDSPKFVEICVNPSKAFLNLINCVCANPQNSFNFNWGSCSVQLVPNVCH